VRFFLSLKILLISFPLFAQDPLPPVGFWREHLPYNSAIDVTSGDGRIYCATPYSIFSVTISGNVVERYSRVSGLSETGISAIIYDTVNSKLFIAYSNSNIDILHRGDIHNVPDIKRDNIIGDKTIYQVHPAGGDYLLSTGLGVVVINGARYEVKASWFIGNGGNQVRVNGLTSDAGFYYAATAEGLKRVSRQHPNPENHASWQLLSGSSGLPPGNCANVVSMGNRLLAQSRDSVFLFNGNTWDLFYASGWPIAGINVSGGKLHVCERMLNGNSRVVILEPSGVISRVLMQPGVISFPVKAIDYGNGTWVADRFGCLSRFDGSGFEQYVPNSPQETASGEMLVRNSTLVAAAGAVNDAWNYQYNGNGVYVFSNGSWANINRYRYPQLDSMLDHVAVAMDPRDGNIWAGSFGGGLLRIRQGPGFEIYKQGFLGPTTGDPGSYRVAGLTFDRQQNLWIANFGSDRPLKVRKGDGTWTSLSVPFTLFENALSQILIDDNDRKWIVSPLGNGLLVLDHGTSIDDLSDDRWKKLGIGTGNGNLPSSEVHCLALDRGGFIWVGTGNGVAVFQCPQDVFSSGGCDAIWPIVPHGNFAGYLFRGQEVRSIAVDAADRKWVATRNGVFLVSADGEKLIYRFTEDNSPLLSSDVRRIAIDGNTGEVYFATLKGICSFRSTATEEPEPGETVLVFPNPVPPSHSGVIAIRGVPANSIVRITEADGRLVFQTRAHGGQAIWDGRDYRGRRVASGVYLVLIENKQSARIVFISR